MCRYEGIPANRLGLIKIVLTIGERMVGATSCKGPYISYRCDQ